MSKSGETKKKKLYPKEKAFADKYIETGNGTQSALEVYDTEEENVAANIAHQNLRKPKIIDYIESKLSDEMLAEKHLMLLNKIDKEGEIDVQAVKAGLDMAYKIKGKYKSEEKPPETKNTYNFILTPEFQGRIKPLEEELKKQFRNAKTIEASTQDVDAN